MEALVTIDIAAPPEAVWALISSEAQVKRWNPGLVSDEPLTPGPPHVGQRSRMKLREGGRVVEYGSEVLVLEPGRRFDLELRGGGLGANPMRVSYTLTPRGAGSRLDLRSSWRPSGVVLHLLAPLFSWIGRRNAMGALRQLRTLAESGS
jgi:uncharacterized protein YndB with AHSA1/START domain